jgi:hypothetical protein
MALLPLEKVKGVVATLRAAQSIVLQPSAAPQSKMVLLAVMEFDGEASARAYLDAARELGAIKAERMKTGPVRITDSKRTDLEGPGFTGFVTHVHMKNRGLELDVTGVDAARGPIVVEAIFSAEPIEDQPLTELAGDLLDAVRRLEDTSAPR